MKTVTAEIELDGTPIKSGDLVNVDGLRGAFMFRRYVRTETSEWVEVWGGTSGREKGRSFVMERVHPRRTRRR